MNVREATMQAWELHKGDLIYSRLNGWEKVQAAILYSCVKPHKSIVAAREYEVRVKLTVNARADFIDANSWFKTRRED
jgi:hypothetical protein